MIDFEDLRAFFGSASTIAFFLRKNNKIETKICEKLAHEICVNFSTHFQPFFLLMYWKAHIVRLKIIRTSGKTLPEPPSVLKSPSIVVPPMEFAC